MQATQNFNLRAHNGQLYPPNTQYIERWTSKLLMFLAFGSFILSYAGMYAVAVDAGYSWLSFLWPLVTETAVVIFSLVYLVAKLKGYENRWLMPLIVGCTALSVAFNVWHSPKADYLTRSVVALPPILLFASFKMWIWKIEQDTKRQGVIVGIDELNDRFTRLQLDLSDFEREADQRRQESQTELDKLTQRRDTLKTHIDELMTAQSDIDKVTYRGNVTPLNAARQSQMEQRRMELLPLLDSDLTQKELAERFDVTPQTIRRDIKVLKEDGYLDGSTKGNALDRLVDALPLDEIGKDTLKKLAESFQNGKGAA